MERSEHLSNWAVIISSSSFSPWSEQALLPTIESGGSGMELFVISPSLSRFAGNRGRSVRAVVA